MRSNLSPLRPLLLRVLPFLLASAACTSMSRAETFRLPPLMVPATAEHHVGKVIWADLTTPDLAAAEQFYGGLFGWTFQAIHAGDSNYAIALADGRPVGGLLQRAIPIGEHRQSGWLTFISVRDADAAARIALSHGGKLVSEARSYPRRGRQAVFSDPQGAVFAVLASSSGDPSDYLAGPGEWIWSTLLAHDAGTEAEFYQQVFGYDVFDPPSDDGSDHLILSSDDFARASVNALPGGPGRRHPHWLNFVRVNNTLEMATKVTALGGRVLVEPHSDRHGGNIAVVADPAGAPFGLMEWTEYDTKVEPK